MNWKCIYKTGERWKSIDYFKKMLLSSLYIVIFFNLCTFICKYMYINENFVLCMMLTVGSTTETHIMSRFSPLLFPDFLQCICIPFAKRRYICKTYIIIKGLLPVYVRIFWFYIPTESGVVPLTSLYM